MPHVGANGVAAAATVLHTKVSYWLPMALSAMTRRAPQSAGKPAPLFADDFAEAFSQRDAYRVQLGQLFCRMPQTAKIEHKDIRLYQHLGCCDRRIAGASLLLSWNFV